MIYMFINVILGEVGGKYVKLEPFEKLIKITLLTYMGHINLCRTTKIHITNMGTQDR